MIMNNLPIIGISIIFPFSFNLLLTYLLIKLAHHKEWYDDVDHRKIHTGDIPRIGGVGVFIASLTSILILLGLAGRSPLLSGAELNTSLSSCIVLLISLALIHSVGLLDDFANLRPLYKLYGQVLAALIVVGTGHHFQSLYFPFFDVVMPLGISGPVLTFLWILGVTNAVNLIDGLDGLSSTVSIVAALFLAFGAAATGNFLPALFAFAMVGALVSFLLFNLPPAKLFMGDSGSMFLGFFLSALPLFAFTSQNNGRALPFAMSLVFIPILDTLGAIVRRKRKGIPLHAPDQEHLHHKLLNFGWSNRLILTVIALSSFLLASVAYLWLVSGSRLMSYVLSLLWAAAVACFFVLHKLNKVHKGESVREPAPDHAPDEPTSEKL